MEGSLGPAENDPVVATALGIAYSVLSVVDRVEPGSPAEAAGLASRRRRDPGGVYLPRGRGYGRLHRQARPERSSEGPQQANWPCLVAVLQELPAGSKVKLSYVRGDEKEKREATLTPDVATGYFLAERGLSFEMVERIRIAGTWSEAVDRGWDETVRSLDDGLPLPRQAGPPGFVHARWADRSPSPRRLVSRQPKGPASCWCFSPC